MHPRSIKMHGRVKFCTAVNLFQNIGDNLNLLSNVKEGHTGTNKALLHFWFKSWLVQPIFSKLNIFLNQLQNPWPWIAHKRCAFARMLMIRDGSKKHPAKPKSGFYTKMFIDAIYFKLFFPTCLLRPAAVWVPLPAFVQILSISSFYWRQNFSPVPTEKWIGIAFNWPQIKCVHKLGDKVAW